MLRLSKKADYALIAMKHLALRADAGASSAREIAEHYDIPVELMAKVLQRLVRTGLLVVAAGHARRVHARAAGQVPMSVADVIQAVDGPLTVTACAATEDTCDQYAKCNVRDPLWRIKDRILLALATCSMHEIATDTVRRRRWRPCRSCAAHRHTSGQS